MVTFRTSLTRYAVTELSRYDIKVHKVVRT
jgi:hypothetical protein